MADAGKRGSEPARDENRAAPEAAARSGNSPENCADAESCADAENCAGAENNAGAEAARTQLPPADAAQPASSQKLKSVVKELIEIGNNARKFGHTSTDVRLAVARLRVRVNLEKSEMAVALHKALRHQEIAELKSNKESADRFENAPELLIDVLRESRRNNLSKADTLRALREFRRKQGFTEDELVRTFQKAVQSLSNVRATR